MNWITHSWKIMIIYDYIATGILDALCLDMFGHTHVLTLKAIIPHSAKSTHQSWCQSSCWNNLLSLPATTPSTSWWYHHHKPQNQHNPPPPHSHHQCCEYMRFLWSVGLRPRSFLLSKPHDLLIQSHPFSSSPSIQLETLPSPSFPISATHPVSHSATPPLSHSPIISESSSHLFKASRLHATSPCGFPEKIHRFARLQRWCAPPSTHPRRVARCVRSPSPRLRWLRPGPTASLAGKKPGNISVDIYYVQYIYI